MCDLGYRPLVNDCAGAADNEAKWRFLTNTAKSKIAANRDNNKAELQIVTNNDKDPSKDKV